MRPRRRHGEHWRPPPWMGLGAALLCLVLVSGQAYGQISVVEDVELDFGAVVDVDGSVVLNLSDTIASDPNGIHVGGFVSSGVYRIQGDPLTAVDIDISAQNGSGLSLSGFTTSEGAPPILAAALDAGGRLDLTLGATLTVTSSQATPGDNQALSFTFTIDYN